MGEHLDVLEAIPGTVLNSLCIFLITSVTKKMYKVPPGLKQGLFEFLKIYSYPSRKR